jgi:hypothetical protein
MSSASPELTVEHMEETVRAYFDACNAADGDAIAPCFLPNGIHYVPPGMYEGPFPRRRDDRAALGQRGEDVGSVLTVDSFIGDPATGRAVIEWSHFKTFQHTLLRGDEWYRFDPATGLIAEIRAYYATPQPPEGGRLELGGFDYKAHGYPLISPIERAR